MVDSKVLPDLEYAQNPIGTTRNPLGTGRFRSESAWKLVSSSESERNRSEPVSSARKTWGTEKYWKKCEEIYNKRTRIYIYISLAVGSNYVDVVLFLRQITTWVSPEIDYEREFQGGLRLFQLFWDILILISGLVSVSTQS